MFKSLSTNFSWLLTEKISFKVVVMHYISCKPIIEKQLKDERVVKSISLDYLTDDVIVVSDPSILTKEEKKIERTSLDINLSGQLIEVLEITLSVTLFSLCFWFPV